MKLKKLVTQNIHWLLILLLITPTFNGATAQNKTWFGVESGFANDLYSLTDNGGYIKKAILDNAPFGLFVRQEFKKNFFFETGVIIKYYQEGYGLNIYPDWWGWSTSYSADPSWIFPLRFGINIPIWKDRIEFSPMSGYVIGAYNSFSSMYGNHSYDATTIEILMKENPNITRVISQIQMGGSFDITLFKELKFTIGASYYLGFNKIRHLDISYTVNNNNTYTGTFISKGSFWYVHTGLRYPVSNIWSKG
ncbi:MAG: hypothetical protein OEW75_06145 [Cyclobacteriaceae bacterium]|nr:hypothetical protein [Cyclobacteriaceae bacterium]